MNGQYLHYMIFKHKIVFVSLLNKNLITLQTDKLIFHKGVPILNVALIWISQWALFLVKAGLL